MKMRVREIVAAMVLAGGMAAMGQAGAGTVPATTQSESMRNRVGQVTQVGEEGQAATGGNQTPGAAAEKGEKGGALTKTMIFKFDNAPVETVLSEMSTRLGFTIVKMGTVPGTITIMVPQPVDADQAISLLNTILLQQKFAVIEWPAQNGQTGRVLRVMPWDQAKKEAPVSGG